MINSSCPVLICAIMHQPSLSYLTASSTFPMLDSTESAGSTDTTGSEESVCSVESTGSEVSAGNNGSSERNAAVGYGG